MTEGMEALTWGRREYQQLDMANSKRARYALFYKSLQNGLR